MIAETDRRGEDRLVADLIADAVHRNDDFLHLRRGRDGWGSVGQHGIGLDVYEWSRSPAEGPARRRSGKVRQRRSGWQGSSGFERLKSTIRARSIVPIHRREVVMRPAPNTAVLVGVLCGRILRGFAD